MDIRETQSFSDEEELIYDHEEGELLNESGEEVRAEGLAHREPQGEELAEASNAENANKSKNSSNTNYSINQLIAEAEKAESSDEINKDDDILAFLTAQAQEKVGPPLADNVTKLITCLLKKDYRRFVNGSFDDQSHGAEMVKKMRDVLIPDNVPDLKACKVNDCIFKSLPPAIKKESAEMQVVESALCKGITAQAKVMELLMGLKKEISASANAKINETLKLLNDSIEFSVFARSRVNDSRRDRISTNINSAYRNLNVTTKPADGLLFGGEMEAAIKQVETTNRLASKLAPRDNNNRRGPFLYRGPRGRGRGYHQRGRFHHHPYRQQPDPSLPPPKKNPRLVT